jgi:hypothetical protein
MGFAESAHRALALLALRDALKYLVSDRPEVSGFAIVW